LIFDTRLISSTFAFQHVCFSKFCLPSRVTRVVPPFVQQILIGRVTVDGVCADIDNVRGLLKLQKVVNPLQHVIRYVCWRL
jgi:hypothetical protein